MVHIPNGIFSATQNEINYDIFKKINRLENLIFKQHKPDSIRQIHVFFHMWIVCDIKAEGGTSWEEEWANKTAKAV